jgi:K+-transporting ATPase c subunit
MKPDAVRQVVARHTQQPFLGFLGEPRVNVLLVNLGPRRPGPLSMRP